MGRLRWPVDPGDESGQRPDSNVAVLDEEFVFVVQLQGDVAAQADVVPMVGFVRPGFPPPSKSAITRPLRVGLDLCAHGQDTEFVPAVPFIGEAPFPLLGTLVWLDLPVGQGRVDPTPGLPGFVVDQTGAEGRLEDGRLLGGRGASRASRRSGCETECRSCREDWRKPRICTVNSKLENSASEISQT